MRRLILLLAVVVAPAAASGCASTGGVPRPFPVPGGSVGRPMASDPTSTAVIVAPERLHGILQTALGLKGVPYRLGGVDPSGFDCSGFVHYVFAQHGHALPRLVRDQYAVGRSIHPRDLQPGDLVFFVTKSNEVSHVGLAVDRHQFVHAPNERGVVRTEWLTGYWADRLVGARRLTP